MRLRFSGPPAALFAAALPLAVFVTYALGSGLAGRASAAPAAVGASTRDRHDIPVDREEVRSAHLSLLNTRIDEWERRAAAGDGEVRLTAREIRYLRRVSVEIARRP